MRRIAPLLLLLCAAAAPPAAEAAAFGRFQHGGRSTAQAGAFVARADEPSAVGVNPAALTRLEGLGLQVGLDFDAPTVRAESSEGVHRAEHSIQFPPAAYLAWRSDAAPFALGLGIDAPVWRFTDWQTRLLPERFTARRSEARLFELRGAGAFELGARWSVGGALRGVRGEIGYGDTRHFDPGAEPGGGPIEIDRMAEADADGFGFELATHYLAPRWGFGATWKSEVELEGRGDFVYTVSDPESVPEALARAAREALPAGSSTLREALPETWTAGIWWGPTERLRVELDASLARWSAAAVPGATHEPARLDEPFALARRGGFDDTLSLRLGAEWKVSPSWSFGAGLAHEPSPAGGDAVEPGMPVGDLTVGSLGASWSMGWLAFDLGWSYHDAAPLRARGQQEDPAAVTTYTARAQVWAVSARWKL